MQVLDPHPRSTSDTKTNTDFLGKCPSLHSQLGSSRLLRGQNWLRRLLIESDETMLDENGSTQTDVREP